MRKPLTLREAVLAKMYKQAREQSVELELELLPHFIERFNLRSPNQDASSLFLMRTFSHAISKLSALENKRAAYVDPTEAIILQVLPDARLSFKLQFVTYITRTVNSEDRWKERWSADVVFAPKTSLQALP